MTPDLLVPVRNAIIGSTEITDRLPTYLGGYPVFTRIPVPNDTPFPFMTILQVGETNDDGVRDFRSTVDMQVTAWGENNPDTVRLLVVVGLLVYQLFHRQRLSLTVPDWSVTQITALGPVEVMEGTEQQARIFERIGQEVHVFVSVARGFE